MTQGAYCTNKNICFVQHLKNCNITTLGVALCQHEAYHVKEWDCPNLLSSCSCGLYVSDGTKATACSSLSIGKGA